MYNSYYNQNFKNAVSFRQLSPAHCWFSPRPSKFIGSPTLLPWTPFKAPLLMSRYEVAYGAETLVFTC